MDKMSENSFEETVIMSKNNLEETVKIRDNNIEESYIISENYNCYGFHSNNTFKY